MTQTSTTSDSPPIPLPNSTRLSHPSKLASVLIRANEQLGTAAPLDSSVELSPLRQDPIAAVPEAALYGDHIASEESMSVMDCTAEVGKNSKKTSLLSRRT